MGERDAVLAVKVGARTQKYSPFLCVWGRGLNQVLKTVHPVSLSYSSYLSTLDLPLEDNFSSA